MSGAPPLNVGVVGLGRMGRIFARHLSNACEGADLGTVYTSRPDSTSDVLGNRDVTVYEDWQDLIADEGIDAVVVATLTNTHHDIVVAAAQAGKSIFCEKPLSLNLSDTDSMLEAIQVAGVPLQVGFMRRFDKGFAAAKERISAGDIGQPIAAHAISRDPTCPSTEWASPESSGGLILDLAIHDFDLLSWLMEDEVERVHAECGNLACPDLAEVNDIDVAMISLRFRNGGLAQVEAARNCGYGYDIRCEIRGTEGTLQVGYLRNTPLVTLKPAGASHDIVNWFEERFTPAYNAQLDHFVDCLRNDRAPYPDGTDARRAQAVCEAANRSLQSAIPIEL